MHDQDTRDPADRGDALERDILYLLTEPNDGQPLWSVEDSYEDRQLTIDLAPASAG